MMPIAVPASITCVDWTPAGDLTYSMSDGTKLSYTGVPFHLRSSTVHRVALGHVLALYKQIEALTARLAALENSGEK